MEVDLGPDGKVLEVRVVQGVSPELDAAALKALRQFVFSPAELDREPAAVRIQYALTFEPPAPPLRVIDAGVPAVNLRGVLRTAGTREPLPGASIVVEERSAVSGESGEFELFDVPVGEVKVTVTATGFERFEATELIRKDERTEVVYYVKPTGVPLLETVVRSEKERREVTQVKLTRAELRSVAGTQGDAFKVLQSLPGVARAAFGSGALVVRGSKSWVNPTSNDAELRELFGRIERQEIQTVMSLTRVTVTERLTKNHNPKLAAIELDGVPVPKGVMRDGRGGQHAEVLPFFICDGSPTPKLTAMQLPASPGDPVVATEENMAGTLDVLIGGLPMTRGSYSPGRDAFLGDAPVLPAGTYAVELRAKNCSAVDTGLTWTVP